MAEKFRIGLLSSAWDRSACDLRIGIEGNRVIDSQGQVLERGYDVTEEIDEM